MLVSTSTDTRADPAIARMNPSLAIAPPWSAGYGRKLVRKSTATSAVGASERLSAWSWDDPPGMLSERVVRAAPAALQQLFGFSETYGFLHIFDATAVPPDGTLPAIALPIWGFGSPFALPTNPVQFDETPQQLTVLTELGCDSVQGSLFSPPVPAATLSRLVARQQRDTD